MHYGYPCEAWRETARSNSMNCPFYGHAMHMIQDAQPPFILIAQHGNQCAVIVEAHSPCYMEMQHQTPDWQTCPLVRDMRGGE